MTADPLLDGVSLLERAIGYALGILSVINRDDLHRATPCHDWDVANLLAHLDDSLTTLNEAATFAQITLGNGARTALRAQGSGEPGGGVGAEPGGGTSADWGGEASGEQDGRRAGEVGGERDGGSSDERGGRWGGEASGHSGGRGSREGSRRGDPVLVLRDRAAELLGAWAHQVRDHVVTIEGCPMAARTVTEVGAVEVAVHAWDLARACGRSRPMPALMAAALLGRAHALVTDADRPERFAEPINQPWRASAEDRLLAFLGRDPGWSPPCRF